MTLAEKLATVVKQEFQEFYENNQTVTEESSEEYADLVGEILSFHNATMEFLGLDSLQVTEQMMDNLKTKGEK